MSCGNIIDKKICSESIRTGRVCADGERIWTHDEVIGGLYVMNYSLNDVECILSPAQMFQYGKFTVASIFEWNKTIIIVPSELDKKWIFYNKNNKRVSYENITMSKWKTCGIHIIEGLGFLIPVQDKYPIIIVDITVMKILSLIKNWNHSLLIEHKEGDSTVGLGVTVGTAAVLHLYNEKYVIMVKKDKIDKYLLDIPYGISSLSYDGYAFWILPTEGNYIYIVDEYGKIVDSIELVINKQVVPAFNFIKIVATERYIFLLPYSNKNMHIYDKVNRHIIVINTLDLLLKNMFQIQCPTAPYWGSYINKNSICFMPLESKFLTVNLKSLEWESKELFLPSSIDGKDLNYWYAWNQWIIKNSPSKELDENSLNLYCALIKNKESLYKMEKQLYIGDIIWEKMKS